MDLHPAPRASALARWLSNPLSLVSFIARFSVSSVQLKIFILLYHLTATCLFTLWAQLLLWTAIFCLFGIAFVFLLISGNEDIAYNFVPVLSCPIFCYSSICISLLYHSLLIC